MWFAGLLLAAGIAVPVTQRGARADGPTVAATGPVPTLATPAGVVVDSAATGLPAPPATPATDDALDGPAPPIPLDGTPLPEGSPSVLWPEALPLPPSTALDGVVLTSSPDRRADLVVVVSIDGLRADALGPWLPTFSRIRREGTSASDATTIRMSFTLPSHAAMVSGVDADQHGLTFNSFRPTFGPIRFPTMFRIARGAGLTTAMFVGKNKLFHLVEDGGAERFLIAGRDCSRVARRAGAYLRTAAPGLVFVHFADPDSAGHRRGWMSPLYRQSVVASDACLGDVLGALEERGHLDRTLLIVTADHGGHGRSHGTDAAEDRHIPWMAWGGAARAGGNVGRPISTMDTAATALAALGLPTAHGMRGVAVLEALRDDRAPRRRPRQAGAAAARRP